MTQIELIRQEIERLKEEYNEQVSARLISESLVSMGKVEALNKVLAFIESLSEEHEKKSGLQDAEVIFSGHALHTDVTKWADGYKLKIRIYDDN